MRLEKILKKMAESSPSKIALVLNDRRISYNDLYFFSCEIATFLEKKCEVCRNDRVVLYLDNSIEAVASLFAVLQCGAVFSMINPATKKHKLKYLVNDLEAKVVITQDSLLEDSVFPILSETTISKIIVVDRDTDYSDKCIFSLPAELENIDVDFSSSVGISIDLAYIMYTSGSTGFPKGVMVTHQGSICGANLMVDYLKITAEDKILSVIPFSFDYGLYQVIMCFLAGATLILEKSFLFPKVFLAKLQSESISILPLVPTTISFLLQLKDFNQDSASYLRCITSTAAPLPEAHSAALIDRFPNTAIYSNYGLTENIRGTYLPPSQISERPNSVGLAIPDSEIYLVNEEGRVCEPFVHGELVFRGPSLFKGYWKKQQETEKVLKTGIYPWEKVFYTGDLFYQDEAGFLYFVSRKDDIIKTRGEKVSPKEVENVIYLLPDVKEVVVYGVEHPKVLNEMVIKAAIVRKTTCYLSSKDVRSHCFEHLEGYMIPSIINFCDSLPKTESGKLIRRDLK